MNTILISGISGFLGSELAKYFMNDYNIIGLKRSSSKVSRIPDANNVILYDLDYTDLEEIFKQNSIDFVIHTAALQGKNISTTSELIDTNISFSVRMAEVSKLYGVKAFIFSDTLLPKKSNLYALSKFHARKWIKKFSSNDMKIINMRLELFFGEKEDAEQFIKSITLKMLENILFLDFTEGRQQRDIIYIDDVVNAYATVIRHINEFKFYESVDVGSGNPIELKKFIEKIKMITNSKTILNFGKIPYSKNDPMYVCAKNDILNKLGWSALVSMDDAIARMVKELQP